MAVLPVNILKSRLKHGPRLGRELRAEYLLAQSDAPARALSPAVLAKIKGELERLEQSASPAVRAFVRQMRTRYPELL